MGEIGRLLKERFEARRIQLPALVTSIPLDADGKSLGYVLAEVSGQPGVRVRIGPMDLYYPGDWLAAEQIGGGAAAQYVAIGYITGARPQSGVWEITGPTTIGTEVFEAGDVVYGNPYDTHWWYDYSSARWLVRNGNTTTGALGVLGGIYGYEDGDLTNGFAFGDYVAGGIWISGDPVNGFRINEGATVLAQWTGSTVTLGSSGGAQLRLQAGAIDFLDAAGAINASFDGSSRTIYGFERLGRPLGPCVEWGPIADPAGERWGFWLRGANNIPYLAAVSGSEADADDAWFRLGGPDAESYLEWRNHRLTVVGDITILNPDGGTVEWDDIANKPATLGTPGVAGLYLTGTHLGYWSGAAWTAYIDNSGNMALGSKLTWNGTTLSIAGEVTATSGKIGNWNINATSLYTGTEDHSGYTANAGDITIYSDGSNASIHAKNFYVDASGNLVATSVNVGGTINATGGTFSGLVQIGSGTPHLHLDGANALLESSIFASGTSGWRIDAAGNTEFNNITARGALSVTALQYGYVLATNGSIWVTPAVGRTVAAVTSVDSPTTFNVDVEDPDGMTHAAAGTLWTAHATTGDVIRLKEPLAGDLWARVTAKTDMTTYWRLVCVKTSPGAGTNYTFAVGGAVLNYGQANAGMLRLTADATNSPYMSIATHAGSPWAALTERVRLGNLTGISGASGYGLWTDNAFLAAGCYIGDATTRIAIEAAGISVGNAGSIRGGQTAYNTGTGFWLGYSGAYKFSIGDGANNYLTWDGTSFMLKGSTSSTSAGVITATTTGNNASARAIYGESTAANGTGVYGYGSGLNSIGVYGYSAQNTGVVAQGAGYGLLASAPAGIAGYFQAGLSAIVAEGNGPASVIVSIQDNPGEGTRSANFTEWTDAIGAVYAAITPNGGLIINEKGAADADTRIESDTEANMVLVDASADAVYLGGTTNGIKVAKGGVLSLEGTATMRSKGVLWVSAADAVSVSYEATTAARMHPNGYTEGPYADTTEMYFRLGLPYQLNGLTTKITEIKFYGYSSANAFYFDTISLRASDLDGTVTDLLSYTTDIGNGSSGDVNATIYSGAGISLTDYPTFLMVKLAGGGSYDNYRIYGFRVVWETA